MASKPKPAPVIEIDETPLGDYLYEVAIIADAVVAQSGTSRDRAMIRQTVERHIHQQQAEAKKRDRKFQPLSQARVLQVARGLAIGVTKALEAWEYVDLNRVWPPDDTPST